MTLTRWLTALHHQILMLKAFHLIWCYAADCRVILISRTSSYTREIRLFEALFEDWCQLLGKLMFPFIEFDGRGRRFFLVAIISRVKLY